MATRQSPRLVTDPDGRRCRWARIADLFTDAGRDGYQIATGGGHIVTAVTIFSRWRPVAANLRSSGGGLECSNKPMHMAQSD